MLNTLQKNAALLCALFLFFAACKKPANPKPGPNEPVKPELTSFLPLKGMSQTEVKIKGKNFNLTKAMNEVRFGGTLTQVVEATATELTVTVPAGAVTGKITVKVGTQTATSATDFTVEPETLSIIDFTPKQGPFGTTVTITGREFGDDITVKINSVTAQLKQRSATSIVFLIPANTSLTAHKVQVTSDGNTVETATDFTVTAPGAYAEWVDLQKEFIPAGVFPFGVSFVHKNKIYWGFTNLTFAEPQTDYVVYDPADHAKGWALQNHPPADMAPSKLIHATAVVHQDRVFFGTGFLQDATNDWWEFKPETNTAVRLTSYPEKTANSISFVLNGNIYAGFGGVSKQLYKFDPAGNGTWQPAVTGTFREMNNSSAAVVGNDVYIGGAIMAAGGARKALFKFTAPDQLLRVNDLPDELAPSVISFVKNNKIYFISQRNVWEYTPDATGGTYRAVIGTTTGPVITNVAEVMVNGAKEIYGWTSSGRLHKFRFK
jgi:hypothetical protein